MGKWLIAYHSLDERTIEVEAESLGAALDKAKKEYRRYAHPVLKNVTALDKEDNRKLQDTIAQLTKKAYD